MHPKLKSTVSGLFVVAGFVFGGALVGEPLPTAAQRSALDAVTPAVTPAVETASLVKGVVVAAEQRARESNRRRLHLTMPYFAVGRLLPHTGES
jgi:hypothetical protein